MRARRLTSCLVLAILAAACADDDGGERAATAHVRVVSQNLLHGVNCPAESNACDLPGRVDLFLRQLDEAGCPELVGLQEANGQMVSQLRDGLSEVCDGAYDVVSDADPGLDREVVLTTLPVLGQRRTRLAGPLRTALWVRVAADVGVVDFVSSHLASGSDDRPCDARTCPPPCDGEGMVGACQGRQLLAFADEVAGDDAVVVIGGDLNAPRGEPAVDVLVEGGYADTHLVAGNAECDPATGDQCTSGRVDDALTDLVDPESQQSERIDYLLIGGSRHCDLTDPTGLFNGSPAEPPGAGGLVFPSDHTGVEATIECETTDAQREAASSATVTTSPPTTAGETIEVDPATEAAITESFETLFGGVVTDPDQKLAVLEDSEVLRPFFLESFEAQRDIASQISVRIDEVILVDATHANVTYSLLLDDSVVLDHLPGAAVEVGGQWLVTRGTYCDVSTQGQPEIPPPCQSASPATPE
ncbi:MAG: endonuclease/exonuclease/phosphatase family protein [Acidimicrobiales bacterium]